MTRLDIYSVHSGKRTATIPVLPRYLTVASDYKLEVLPGGGW